MLPSILVFVQLVNSRNAVPRIWTIAIRFGLESSFCESFLKMSRAGIKLTLQVKRETDQLRAVTLCDQVVGSLGNFYQLCFQRRNFQIFFSKKFFSPSKKIFFFSHVSWTSAVYYVIPVNTNVHVPAKMNILMLSSTKLLF